MSLPLSYWMLGPVAALMLCDLWSTVVGIRAGCAEANAIANSMLGRWGALGLSLYAAGMFLVVALFVFFFPDQWGMPLLFAVETATLVAQNVGMIRKARGEAKPSY